MEHRWGWRLRVDLTARVGDATGQTNIARLRDVSVSGAFLETAAIVRAHSCVDVQFRTHLGSNSRPLSAHVVRTTPEGIAVEWSEFAPREVARLMEPIRRRSRFACPPSRLRLRAKRQRVARWSDKSEEEGRGGRPSSPIR